jgi:hypothetical protein
MKDLGEADFDLPDGQAMVVPGGTVRVGHWPRQTVRPAIEEGLHVGGAECVAGGLERDGIGAGPEAVVETLEANTIAPEALLHPFVAIETELHGIGQIRADLEERRAPRPIVDIKVVVVDGDRLAREVEADLRPRPRPLCALNDRIFSWATPRTTTPSGRVKRARYRATMASLS